MSMEKFNKSLEEEIVESKSDESNNNNEDSSDSHLTADEKVILDNRIHREDRPEVGTQLSMNELFETNKVSAQPNQSPKEERFNANKFPKYKPTKRVRPNLTGKQK